MEEKSNKNTILVIDDTPMIISALCRILLPYYYIKVAKNGEEGIAIAKEYDICLILLDINMPGISGFDVISRLKESENTSSIPIILVTGAEESELESQGLQLGAIGYIKKPFEEEEILQRVKKYIGGLS
ncbi:MAG: response regulator [Defluviitaleaceae bacterium]|nr:response regulator [Defluviitaleaceae bacterium]